ncbi:hypothetical protein [Streptomyces sp. NPDC087298]|uniref:hypothetical protein n=1 Tax=Streptomyces sp. NPDC087298 TaxID=3365779 RepID=UPI0037F146E5
MNEPLALSPAMHTVLASAVHSLLKDPRLTGRSDLVRLAAVVLLAKAPSGSAVVDMSSRDVGGWLGCSLSHVGHTAVPGLKATGAVLCRPNRTDEGRTEGLRLELLPLREARAAADGRPLAMLTKRELATLLRFCEAVTCPGWSPPGKAETPAGFMAHRRGRGAPTDRLAMVLLSLEARTDGRVRMAPGRVPQGFRRADATVARLLNCAVEAAAMVVDRLVAAGHVELEDTKRPGGGRLRVPAVAAAHARVRQSVALEVSASPVAETEAADQEPCSRCTEAENEAETDAESEAAGMALSGDGWAQESLEDVLLTADTCAFGDQPTERTVNPQVSRGSKNQPDNAVCADLHTAHTPVAALSGFPAGDREVFSGSAVEGRGRRRGRACAGEDSAGADSPRPRAGRTETGADPLRGEKPEKLPGRSTGTGGARLPRAAAVPQDLAEALAPVAHLWTRITRLSTVKWLAKAVRAELVRLSGIVGPELALRALAARLTRRLDGQGPHAVRQLVGWLLHRGLPQRSGCWSFLCDDGYRLDTGDPCESCACLIDDRRSMRRSIAATVDEQLSTASPRLRLAEVERRLREAHHAKATADQALRHQRDTQNRAQDQNQHQDLRRAAAQRRRQELAAAEAAHAAMACRECGLPDTAGECPVCAFRKRTDELIGQAVDLVVALRVDSLDLRAVAEMTSRVEQDTRTVIERAQARAQTADSSADPGVRAHEVQQLATKLLAQRRHWALQRLAESEPADEAAERAYQVALRRTQWNATPEKRRDAAEKAAVRARHRVAQDLLTDLLRDLSRARANLAVPPERVPWKERLAKLASGDQAQPHALRSVRRRTVA